MHSMIEAPYRDTEELLGLGEHTELEEIVGVLGA